MPKKTHINWLTISALIDFLIKINKLFQPFKFRGNHFDINILDIEEK